jgi:hypothetical protein
MEIICVPSEVIEEAYLLRAILPIEKIVLRSVDDAEIGVLKLKYFTRWMKRVDFENNVIKIPIKRSGLVGEIEYYKHNEIVFRSKWENVCPVILLNRGDEVSIKIFVHGRRLVDCLPCTWR